LVKKIKKFSGIQFDPKVVDAFFKLLEEEKQKVIDYLIVGGLQKAHKRKFHI